jgi:hypothetical protein
MAEREANTPKTKFLLRNPSIDELLELFERLTGRTVTPAERAECAAILAQRGRSAGHA